MLRGCAAIPLQAPASPLLGVGELHLAREAAEVRHRNLAWFREQERLKQAAQQPWGETGNLGPKGRPLSAGPAMNRPTAPQLLPPEVARAQARLRSARYPGVQPQGVPKPKPPTPFARVDNPPAPISPAAVRARQQVFYQKHAKPEVQPRLGAKPMSPADHMRGYDRQGAIANDIRITMGQNK